MRAPFALSIALAAAASACVRYRPARFADRPPVADAYDDTPIPMPRWRSVPESVYLSEIYLHRPLRETLDLSPYPNAGDVNSLDEVARSSWFTPTPQDVGAMARGPDTADPPRPPFTVIADTPMALAAGGFCIFDARGQRYEIGVDVSDRPEMRTAATAIAARLTWAIGLNTPAAFVLQVRPEDFWNSEGAARDVPAILASGPPPVGGYYRVVALAWPHGVFLGYAAESGGRGDDPNDVVPHEDRRTLRALKVFASWMALDGLGPKKTVDRYVGAPGEGFIQHYLVGLDEALGAGNVVRASDPPPAEGGGSPFVRLLTLGLWPNHGPRPTQIEVPAVGQLDADVDPAGFEPPMPYDPADRLLAPDGYWAAKRIAALTRAHIALAVEAGKTTDPRARTAIQAALEARRRRVVSHWFDQVTPIELMSLEKFKLTLRDEAVYRGIVRPDGTVYRVDFLTTDGDAADESLYLHPVDEKLEMTLPDGAILAARDYLVVRVLARRGGRLLPRAFELHLRLRGSETTVLGARH